MKIGDKEMIALLSEQIPDDVVFVDDIPHTATGKMQKLKLRELFKDHVLPGV